MRYVDEVVNQLNSSEIKGEPRCTQREPRNCVQLCDNKKTMLFSRYVKWLINFIRGRDVERESERKREREREREN